MPRGASDIPELRLETLQKFVTKFTAPPDLILSNLFGTSQAASSSITWESQRGSRGLTPFSPTDAPAQATEPHGVAKHRAEAAYWKEKIGFGEEFLNNIRKEGTLQDYMAAKQRLAREMAQLTNRSNRRLEWMFARMIADNGFSYAMTGGYKASVDYGIPSDHRVTLTTNYKWKAGSTKDILGDIRDGKKKISEDAGAAVDYAICNSTVLDYIARDSTVQGLLSRDKFGDGDLYKGTRHPLIGINPSVVGTLLDIPNFIIYDEMYEIRAWLTAAVTGSSTTTISVDDTTDFAVGDTVRFHNTLNRTYEDETVSAVNTESGTLTISAAPTLSFRAGSDYVSVRKYFIPEDKFIMFASKVEGQPIAEHIQAPFGLGRHYGQFVDEDQEWDPEIQWIRVQDKGLPVLYQEDAIYTIDVQ